jgi:uncharacterized protein (TIGR03067 family)
MRKKLIPIFLLAFVCPTLSGLSDEPLALNLKKEAADPSPIEGVWQLTRITAPSESPQGFEEAPPGYAEMLKITFKDGKMSITPGEPGYTHHSYTNDFRKEPKHLDWKPVEKRENGDDKMIPSIYKIEGNMITIMFDPDKRPVGFDRKKYYVYEGRRVVKAVPKKPNPKD